MRKLFNPVSYQVAGSLITLLVVFLLVRYVPVVETIGDLRFRIASWGRAAIILYPALIAVCNLLLLPGGILNVGGGFFFGLGGGFAIVLFGNIAGAAVAFAVGRLLGRRRMEKLLARTPKWAHLDEVVEREGWKIILLSQLHPLFPVSLINYVYGITRIRFWPCMLWTLVGRIPGIFLYVYLGTLGQFGLNLLAGTSTPTTLEYILWTGGLLLTLVVTAALGRLATRMLREADQHAKAARPIQPL